MAKIDELQAQIEQMRQQMQQAGIMPMEPVAADVTKRADYIAHGSDAHAAFLGLVEVTDPEQAKGRNTYKSPKTGRTWMLEDEITGFVNYPNPAQAALLVLRQKVNELDTAPTVPVSPAMWRPVDD